MSTMATIRMMAADRKRYTALRPRDPRAVVRTAVLLLVFAAIAVTCALTLGFWATVPPALVLPVVFGWYLGSRVALRVNAAGMRVGSEFTTWESLREVVVRPGPEGTVEVAVNEGEHHVLVDPAKHDGERLRELVATYAHDHVSFTDRVAARAA